MDPLWYCYLLKQLIEVLERVLRGTLYRYIDLKTCRQDLIFSKMFISNHKWKMKNIIRKKKYPSVTHLFESAIENHTFLQQYCSVMYFSRQ